MKRAFRSIINIKKDGAPSIPLDELTRNYKAFLTSRVQPEESSYVELYSWIEAHYREFKEIPSFELLYEKAVAQGKEAILASLKDISEQMPYIRSDYKAILKEKFEEQNTEKFRDIVQKTYQVASTGLKIKKNKEIKGIAQAIDYFTKEAREYRILTTGLKTDSEIRSPEDRKEVLEGYAARKKDPLSKLGMFTTLEKIDDVFKGIKLGELFIIAAFVAQGKSTFTAAMVYQAIVQGLNGIFVSLEMTFDEMRDMFYVLHTTYEGWYNHPEYKGRFKDMVGRVSYEKVRYGELSEKEEEFFNIAAKDFETRADFGKLILIQPPNALTPSAFELEVYDRKAQLLEMGRTLDFAVIDYIGLMVQDKSESYGEFNIDLNNIIKRLKNMAITFDNGRGLIVITPFQVNREGWKDAAKNEGVYKLTSLSNANESERSADGVISLFMSDENKKNGIMKITCLKHRKGGDFSPFEAHVDFNTKRIYNIIQKAGTHAPHDDESMDVSDITNSLTELNID